MDRSRAEIIRGAARELLLAIWANRSSLWPRPPSLPEVFPLDLKVVTTALGLNLVEPEEILPDEHFVGNLSPNVQFAGFLDRPNRRIVVAQKFLRTYRRFTG